MNVVMSKKRKKYVRRARAGLIIQRASGELFLTTVTHLLIIHNHLTTTEEEAFGLSPT
jgi:hypothetical protein